MLKISLIDSTKQWRPIVEGKLIAPWASELRNACQHASADLRDRQLVIEMKHVMRINPEGENIILFFGIGQGMVNPAITNSAVDGMPLSQAGVAAATASTSRQVGAALGVAVSGTVVAASYARGMDFPKATHAIWWVMTACGVVVLILGFAANTAWARASRERVAQLLEEQR
jgi:hypothetical protein